MYYIFAFLCLLVLLTACFWRNKDTYIQSKQWSITKFTIHGIWIKLRKKWRKIPPPSKWSFGYGLICCTDQWNGRDTGLQWLLSVDSGSVHFTRTNFNRSSTSSSSECSKRLDSAQRRLRDSRQLAMSSCSGGSRQHPAWLKRLPSTPMPGTRNLHSNINLKFRNSSKINFKAEIAKIAEMYAGWVRSKILEIYFCLLC